MSEREDLDTDLTGAEDEDPLDAGYSPPDSARGSYAHGVTAAEQREGESIDQRLKQEDPDTTWEVDEPGRIGGDDPDAIAAEDDWIGDSEVGDARAGRLVSPDEGAHDDTDDQAWGRDVGVDGGAASAEEAAVHVIDGRAEEED